MAKSKNMPVVVCDIDGVLNDIQGGGMKDFVRPGYFESRPARRGVMLSLLLLACSRVDVRIVSAVYSDDIADAKRRWLAANGLGGIPAAFPPCGASKMAAFPDIAGRRPLLLDDHTPNLIQWERDGGVAVKFLNGANGKGGRWRGAFVADGTPPADMATYLRRLAEGGCS